MVVKAGEIINLKGNNGAGNNFLKNKPWKDAINRAFAQYEDKSDDPKRYVKRGEALFKIANEMVECALDRNNENFQFAVKEIGMRQDGKPIETVELGDATQKALGISQAFSLLADFAGREEVVIGETLVPDRPLLSVEVCVEAGGHGERVDIPEVSGGSGES